MLIYQNRRGAKARETLMRIVNALAALLLATAPAVAEPFQHSSGEWREYFRDWLAACPAVIDEDGTDYYSFSCFASTGSAELNRANLPNYKLTLLHNRLDGTLDLAVTVATEAGNYDQSRPIGMRFAGAPAVMLAYGTDLETRYNTTNQFFVIDAARVEGLIDTMKERNFLVLSVPIEGKEKPVEMRMSLRGVTASLDFMAAYSRRVAQY